MKMLHALILALLAMVSFVSAGEPPDDPVKAADELLQKRFPADKPGAAVLVIRDGKLVLEKGYGLADLETKSPITPQTQFDLASVAKQFTSMAVMVLANRGKLTFDDDVRKLLPELPEFDPKRPIRVSDLLRHTSGMPDYLGIWKGDDAAFAELTNEKVLALLAKEKPRFPTGTKFEYSNSNYALLAVVVARAAGKPFAAFLREAIFDPAGMNNTLVFDAMSVKVPARAVGYRRPLFIGALEKSVRDGPVHGDGNVFTTIEELAKWDAALAGNKLVKPETLKLAFTPGKLDNGKEFPYGFGWAIRGGDRPLVWHNGGWAGTRTFIGRRLDIRFTVAVLSNLESTNPEKVAADVAAVILEPKEPPKEKGKSVNAASEKRR